MKRITFEKEDYAKIKGIVGRYRKIDENLTNIQTQLERLDKERAHLFESLDTTRAEEEAFFENIKEKYGDGKFDLLTNEYVIYESNES